MISNNLLIILTLSTMQETWVQSLGQEDPLEKGRATSAPVSLPGEFHRQRNLEGYNLGSLKESGTTEGLSLRCSTTWVVCCFFFNKNSFVS